MPDTPSTMPKWRPAPDELKRRFQEAIQPLPGAEPRKMFGFPCAFYNGQMFAGLFQEQMFVRLPEDQRRELLALPGAVPFEPMAGRPMREYIVLPETVLADTGALTDWLDKALAYVAAMPPKPLKEKKPPKAKGAKAAK